MGLGKFLIKRCLQGVLVIWGVVTVVFFLRFLTPGNPTATLLPPDAGPEVRERLRQNLGLDQPLYVQYAEYMSGLLVGDLGVSLQTRNPVLEDVLFKLPATLELITLGLVFMVAIGVPLGVVAARNRGGWLDNATRVSAFSAVSVPSFFIAIM